MWGGSFVQRHLLSMVLVWQTSQNSNTEHEHDDFQVNICNGHKQKFRTFRCLHESQLLSSSHSLSGSFIRNHSTTVYRKKLSSNCCHVGLCSCTESLPNTPHISIDWSIVTWLSRWLSRIISHWDWLGTQNKCRNEWTPLTWSCFLHFLTCTKAWIWKCGRGCPSSGCTLRACVSLLSA